MLVKKFDIPKASSKNPHKEIVKVYDVQSGMVLVVPYIALYSENEVTKAKVLQDGSPIFVFETVWGNPNIQPIRIIAETNVSIEVVNETPKEDRIWVQLIGVEISRENLEPFLNRLKTVGIMWIC